MPIEEARRHAERYSIGVSSDKVRAASQHAFYHAMGMAEVNTERLHAVADYFRRRGHFINVTTIGPEQAREVLIEHARAQHLYSESKEAFDPESVDTRCAVLCDIWCERPLPLTKDAPFCTLNSQLCRGRCRVFRKCASSLSLGCRHSDKAK